MRKTLLGLSLIAALTGCNDDDKNETIIEQVANVKLVALEDPEQTTYQPGQPINIDFTIESQLLDTEHVGVAFMAIAKTNIDQLTTDEEPEGFDLGTHYISQLSDGEHHFTAELMLPNEEIPSDEYVIAAYVDSAQLIESEADLDDNRSRNYAEDTTTYAQINIDSKGYHDFQIDVLSVGDGFAMFPDIGNRETTSQGAPSHKRSDLVGHFDAVKYGSSVNNARVTAKLTIDGVDFDAHFWQEELDHYSDGMMIKFNDHEQSHYFPYDIAINGILLDKLQQSYDSEAEENSFELTFTIHDLSEYEEANVENNTLQITVPYSLYDQQEPDQSMLDGHGIDLPESTGAQVSRNSQVSYVPGNLDSPNAAVISLPNFLWAFEIFANTYGDKSKVAIVPSFISWVLLQSSNGGYASALATGAFDLYMFDHSMSLFSAGAWGTVDGGNGTATYSMNVSLLGNDLIDEGETISALDESYGYDWEEEQKLFSTTFTIVIVPISVSAGVTGSVGVNTDLVYADQTFSIGGDVLTASLDAYATAGIDLLIASGGIGVDFLIISDTLSATAYVDVSKALSDSEITYGIDVSNNMKAIEGEFYLWVKYPGYKFCCSFPTKTATKTLYNTGALYDKTWQMIDYSDSFKF